MRSPTCPTASSMYFANVIASPAAKVTNAKPFLTLGHGVLCTVDYIGEGFNGWIRETVMRITCPAL